MHGIGTPAKQTSSLDPAGLKYSVFFLLIRSPFPSSNYYKSHTVVKLCKHYLKTFKGQTKKLQITY